MFTFFALLVAMPFTSPVEPLVGQLRAAIWYDLQVDSMIGNGNWLGSLWYSAGSDNPKAPNLHIQDLRCRSGGETYGCLFTLFRDGGVSTVLGDKAPDKLECKATFVRVKDEEGWSVKHIPPRRTGHSQTTMRCKAMRS